MAFAASSISGDKPVAAVLAVSTSLALAIELPSQVFVGTSSAQAIDALPIQAVFSPIRSILSPTRAVSSVSSRSGCKQSGDDESSLPAERFCCREELLRTRMEISPFCKLTSSPVQKAARGGHETNTVTALSLAAVTVSSAKMEVSVYMSRFPHWLKARRFLSTALEDECTHVLIQKSYRNMAFGAWTCRTAMWNRLNWQWILDTFSSVSAEMVFQRCGEGLPCLRRSCRCHALYRGEMVRT